MFFFNPMQIAAIAIRANQAAIKAQENSSYQSNLALRIIELEKQIEELKKRQNGNR